MRKSPIAILVFAMLALAGRASAAPTSAPATQSAAGDFEVHEWAVFVVDAAQNKMNPDGVVLSTLPSSLSTRRQSGPEESQNDPFPVGIIRLVGKSATSVDVALTKSDGEFLASWPRAENRTRQLLWRDLKLTDEAEARGIERVADGHWFNTLRTGGSAFLSVADGPGERFLLYDVEMPYTSALSVKTGKDFSVEYGNVSKAMLHRVVIYQPTGAQWRQAMVGDLPPAQSTPSTKPAETQPATTQAATTQPATTQVAATGPANTRAASSKPASNASALAKVTLTLSPSTRPADLAAAWREPLQKAGVADADCDVILAILAKNVFDSRRLAAVYLMDESEFDRILPLEVLPEPKKTVRVGIVIVRNADPEGGTDLDDLIAQLGDPVWAKRDDAYKALQKLGPAADAKLKAATKNKDLEIVWRAERLLASEHQGKP